MKQKRASVTINVIMVTSEQERNIGVETHQFKSIIDYTDNMYSSIDTLLDNVITDYMRGFDYAQVLDSSNDYNTRHCYCVGSEYSFDYFIKVINVKIL